MGVFLWTLLPIFDNNSSVFILDCFSYNYLDSCFIFKSANASFNVYICESMLLFMLCFNYFLMSLTDLLNFSYSNKSQSIITYLCGMTHNK